MKRDLVIAWMIIIRIFSVIVLGYISYSFLTELWGMFGYIVFMMSAVIYLIQNFKNDVKDKGY